MEELNALIVFASQILYVLLRVANTNYVVRDNVTMSVITGGAVGICSLASLGLGIDAVLNLEPITISSFIVGGGIGTIIGMKISRKENIKNNK